MKVLIFLALAFLFTLPKLAFAEENRTYAVRAENNVVYGKGGERDLKMDVYMPREGDGPFPAVLCLHGGSWRAGSYKDIYVVYLAGELAKHGYVAVTAQYRLVPEATFPAQIEDCKCAVRWLRANAEKYKIDADHIGVVGFSAGGHLGNLLGLTCKEDGFEGHGGCAQCSSQVQAVVDFFGPADLRGGDWPGQTTLKDLLGGTVKEKPEAYAKASPILYVRKDKPLSPFLIIHGTADKLVQYKHSVQLAEAIKAAGGQAELITMEGEGHGWLGPKMVQSLNDTVQFLDKHLKTKAASLDK